MGENRTCVSCVGSSCEADAFVGCSCSLSEEGLVRFCLLRQGSLSECKSVVGSGGGLSISDSGSVSFWVLVNSLSFSFSFPLVSLMSWGVFWGWVSSGAITELMIRGNALEAQLRLASIPEAQRNSTVNYRVGNVIGDLCKSNHPYPILYVLKPWFFQSQAAYFRSIKFPIALQQFD